MSTLIRIADGRETPAPGRWSIAPGHPVTVRSGRWWQRIAGTERRTIGRSGIPRTGTGSLLISESGALAFKLPVVHQGIVGERSKSVTYQSISFSRAAGDGVWIVDGVLLTGGHVIPARSVLSYHGVFRTGSGAVAWLGWHMPIVRIPDAGTTRRLEISADLNADAPLELTTPIARTADRRPWRDPIENPKKAERQ
jgi:hypothetical protein